LDAVNDSSQSFKGAKGTERKVNKKAGDEDPDKEIDFIGTGFFHAFERSDEP
jgi:hypothetical protein